MGTKTSVKWSRVLIDVCTQRDFLDAGAILQVLNREALVENLKRIFVWLRSSGLAVVSCVESHRPTEMLCGFPLHCIDNTPGQTKLGFTLLKPWHLVEADNSLSLPPDLCSRYRQLIFRKRSRDVLGNPKADRFLTHLNADENIICGVGLERAVKSLALGLIARHQRATVITDACGYWSSADAELAIRQLAAKGVRLLTTDELTAKPVLARRPKSRARALRDRHHPVRSGYAGRSASASTASKR